MCWRQHILLTRTEIIKFQVIDKLILNASYWMGGVFLLLTKHKETSI